MTTKKIDELPLSQLTTQELLGAYLPVSGIGGDADELQKINFANLKAMLLDNRAVEPHEYWRVYFDANNSTSFCGLTELQFFKANSITNAVSMFPGTPLSSGGTPALAFDNGASSSGWNVAGSNQQWIGYHFSKAVGIARVRITAAQFTDQSPKDFRVQYSDNGTDWTDAWTVTGQTDWFNGEVRQFIDPDPVWIDGGEDGTALANKRIWAFYDAPNNVVRAGNGISISRTGAGNYQVTFDVPRQDINYAILFGTADMGYQYGSNIMVYWNSKTVDGFTISSYSVENRSRYDPLMSIEVIDASNDTLGGFTDAPIDGKVYARKNGKWVQVGGSGAQERVKAAARIDCTNPTAPTIAGGFNVSGINRLGVGVYEISFTTAIDPATLAFNGGGQWNTAANNTDTLVVGVDRNGGMTATKITINTKTLSVNSGNGNVFDCDNWFSFEVYDPSVASGGGGGSSGGIGDEAPTDGKGYVRRDAEWEAPAFSDLSDFAVTSPLNGQSLIYDAVTQKWKAGTPASKRLAKLIQSGHSGDVTSITLPANPKVGNLLVYVGAGQSRIPATPANWTSLNATTDPNGRVNAAVMCRIVDQAQSNTNVVLVAPEGDYGAASVYEIDIDGRNSAAAIKRVDVFMEAASQAYQITDAALVLAVSIARPGGSTITLPADDWVYDGKGTGDNRNSWAWHQYAVAGQTVSPLFTNTSVSDYMSAVIYIDNADNSINEAPSDDGVYARRNRQWVPSIQDAPVDGRQYARKDGGWAQVVASGAASGGGNAKEGRVFVAGGVFNFDDTTLTKSDLSGCSVSRVAAGRYKITFDQPMANTDYGVIATGKWADVTDGGSLDIPLVAVDRGYPAPAMSTTSFYLMSRSGNGTAYDSRISFAVYEDSSALTQILGGGINAAGAQGLGNIRQAIKLAEVQYPVITNTSDLSSPRFDYKIDWGGLVALAYHGQVKSSAKVPATQATYQVPAGKKVYLVDGWGGTQNISNGGFYGHRLFNVTQNVSMVSPNTGQMSGDGWQMIDGALTNGNADSIMPTAKVIGVAGDVLQCEIWNPSGDSHTRMNMGVYILAVVDEDTNELADFTEDALIGTTAKNAIFNYTPVKIEQISAGAKHTNSTASVVFPAAPRTGNTILLLVASYSGAAIGVPAGFERIVYSVPSANQGFFAYRKTATGTGETSLAVSINDGGSAVAYELSGEIGNFEWVVQGGASANFNYYANDTKYGDVPLRFLVAEHDDTGAISITNPKFTLDYYGSGAGNHWGIFGRVPADFHGPIMVNFTTAANNFVGELTVTGPREIVPVIGETPSMVGNAGKVLVVNEEENGLAWVTAATGGGGGSISTGAPFAGALVKLTANEAIASATNTNIPWDAEVYDTSAFWSASNPTRLTVPAGVSRVRLTGQMTCSSATDQLYVSLFKNGQPFDLSFVSDTDTTGADSVNAVSPVLNVVEGDYFELNAYGTGAKTLTVANTWFAIEAVEQTAITTSTIGKRKFWRVNIVDSQSDAAHSSIANLEFRTVAGTPQLATGGRAISVGDYDNASNLATAYAFDGDAATRWAAYGRSASGANAYVQPFGDRWIGYEYASPIVVSEVMIQATAANIAETPTVFSVQFSDDGAQWFTAGSFSSLAWTAGETRLFTIPSIYTGIGGGASALTDLSDVDLSTPPTDGQALVWDEAGEKWVPGSVAASSGGESIGGIMKVRQDFAPPLAATFPVKSGTSTVQDHEDFGLLLTSTAGSTSTDVLSGIWKAKPAGATWSVIGRIKMSSPSVSYTSYHMGVRNSTTGNMVSVGNTTFSNTPSTIEVNRWNATAFNAAASPARVNSNFDNDFWKIEFDGTNLKFYTSNNTQSWYYLGAEAASAFIGSFDQVGFVVNNKIAADSVVSAAILYYSDSDTPARATPMLIGGAAPWSLSATGTAAPQTVTLPENGLDTKSVLVFFNGIKQPSSSYIISGTDLTLTSNAVGDAIEIQRAAAASPNMTATIVSETADFTLGFGDLGQYKRVGNASAVTITVPANATVPFPIGSQMNFVQTGAGQLLFSAAAGVTINYAETLKTRKKLSAATLTKIAENEWDIIGDMEMSGPPSATAEFTPPLVANWTLTGGNTTAPTARDLPNNSGLMIEDSLPGGSGRFGCYRGMATPAGAHQIDLVYSVFRPTFDFYAFYGPGYMQSAASRVAGWAHADTETASPQFGSPTRWTAYDAIEGGLTVTNNLNSVTESLTMIRMRFVNDGTNITVLRSIDEGTHWIELSTFPISTPFTAAPDVFGFFVFGTATGGTVNFIVHDIKVSLL